MITNWKKAIGIRRREGPTNTVTFIGQLLLRCVQTTTDGHLRKREQVEEHVQDEVRRSYHRIVYGDALELTCKALSEAAAVRRWHDNQFLREFHQDRLEFILNKLRGELSYREDTQQRLQRCGRYCEEIEGFGSPEDPERHPNFQCVPPAFGGTQKKEPKRETTPSGSEIECYMGTGDDLQ